MDDYELSNTPCPKCGHSPTHYRDCTGFCNDGFIDEYEDGPINFMPGEEERICEHCWGSRIECWCPECGFDISKYEYVKNELQLKGVPISDEQLFDEI